MALTPGIADADPSPAAARRGVRCLFPLPTAVGERGDVRGVPLPTAVGEGQPRSGRVRATPLPHHDRQIHFAWRSTRRRWRRRARGGWRGRRLDVP
jgi:hypothetical protein